MTFQFKQARDHPVLSIVPLVTRMVAAYRDRTDKVHLFCDAYDPKRETVFDDPLDSWEAEVRYLTTADFEHWEDHGFAITRGTWTGDVATSDYDCVGAGSPGVTVAGDNVLHFYAGRGPTDPGGPFVKSMNREDLPGRIQLAIAPADENGAPAGPFVKCGPITDYDAPWRSIRHDDPCPIVVGDEILLFYKGIGPGTTRDNRVIALARAPVDRPEGQYEIHPDPILVTKRGSESPRVFRTDETWHMFTLQYSFEHEDLVRRYVHLSGTDPFHWDLVKRSVKGRRSSPLATGSTTGHSEMPGSTSSGCSRFFPSSIVRRRTYGATNGSSQSQSAT